MRLSLGAAFAAAAFVSGTCETQNAIANGDTRSLSIYHTHSKETATITFKRHGSYDRAGLEQLNHILRDWRTHDKIAMDPRLFDVVWEVHREVGSRGAIHIVSAYRAPATNAMLRRRSGGVAKHSQHTLGKAMDFSLPDVAMDKVRAVAMRLQRGGVGYYPSSNAFVHLDVGSVRSWPRMTHDQLARLFPDGKTVHLPSDGKPLAGYEEARASILARGDGGSATSYADAGGLGSGKNFWASLFGGGADEADDAQEAKPAAAASRVALRPTQAPVAASLAVTAPLPVARPTFDEAPATQVALAPLPPKRPDDLAPAVTLVNAPLPPLRPLAVASLVPLRAAASDGAAVAASEAFSRTARESAIAGRIDLVHADNPAGPGDPTLRARLVASASSTISSAVASAATAGTGRRTPAAVVSNLPGPTIAQRGFVRSAARLSSDRFSTASSGISLFSLGFR